MTASHDYRFNYDHFLDSDRSDLMWSLRSASSSEFIRNDAPRWRESPPYGYSSTDETTEERRAIIADLTKNPDVVDIIDWAWDDGENVYSIIAELDRRGFHYELLPFFQTDPFKMFRFLRLRHPEKAELLDSWEG